MTVLIMIVISGNIQVFSQTPASQPEDSIRFSLLTCAPGEEIYSLFGHTGIRYEDPVKGIDVVFNYGIFSFNAPNFTFRFVKGEPDYKLGIVDFSRFKAEYVSVNRAVWEQTLNLTGEEKQILLNLLQVNYLPANRIYRYNIFFDNCATRPRDKIEESIHGKIIYQSIDHRYSFRDIVHQSAKGYEWERFGMDFCLGVEADQPITFREETFSPIYLMEAFAHATIKNDEGGTRPLVSKTVEIVAAQDMEKDKPCPLTPMRSALLLFILTVAFTIYGIRKKRAFWGIDLLLFVLAGLAGSVIVFLSGFSEHPTVGYNNLIFVFHPLHFLLSPFFLRKEIRGGVSYYHLANAVVLTLFILIWPINPQHFNPAVLPLTLCLLTRSAGNLILTYKRHK